MSGLLDRLLPPVPATRPAVARVLLGAYTAAYVGKRVRMLRKVHRTDPELFAPVGPVRVLRRPLPPRVADALVGAELVADAAFTLGVAHRLTGPLHSSLLLWTLSYRNSWSMIFHSDNTLVLHTAVLGLTPTADALSVDAFRRHGRAGLTRSASDWRYGWPGTLCSGVTATAYAVAGIAKVKGPLGWGWASGDSLRSQIAADGLRKELLGSKAAPLGVRLYGATALWRVLAVGSLAVELVAPLALVDRRAARLWAAGAFGMHWGIRAVMGIRFRYQMSGVAYASYLPLEHLLDATSWQRLAASLGASGLGRCSPHALLRLRAGSSTTGPQGSTWVAAARSSRRQTALVPPRLWRNRPVRGGAAARRPAGPVGVARHRRRAFVVHPARPRTPTVAVPGRA